jgi:mannose-6-phosphate isomerase-like protein (cupin superfamily)
MLNRRELSLVLFSALASGAVVAFAQNGSKPAMTSAAIEWNSVSEAANANGSSRKFFEAPSPTLDLLECHASTLKPGAANHEILKRPNDEVVIVKEGTVEAYTGDKWVRVGPGSVVFQAAGADQSIRNPGDTPATYHVIMFRPAARPASPATKPGT